MRRLLALVLLLTLAGGAWGQAPLAKEIIADQLRLTVKGDPDAALVPRLGDLYRQMAQEVMAPGLTTWGDVTTRAGQLWPIGAGQCKATRAHLEDLCPRLLPRWQASAPLTPADRDDLAAYLTWAAAILHPAVEPAERMGPRDPPAKPAPPPKTKEKSSASAPSAPAFPGG